MGCPISNMLVGVRFASDEKCFCPLFVYMCVCSVAKSCLTLYDPVDCKPTRLLCPWDSLGKNTGVGCHFLP